MKLVQYICFVLLIFSCKKSAFLEKIPNDSFIVPSSIEDLERLSNNSAIFNGLGNGVSPFFGEISSDDYFILPGAFSSIAPFYRNMYVWNDDIYTSQKYDWAFPYRAVFYANVILDILPEIKGSEQDERFDIVQGRALFYRSEMFYKLAQVFSPPYNASTAENDLSIPIKLSADVNEKITQSNNKAVYERIIEDLKLAAGFLPSTSEFPNQPSRAAAFGLLARVYLNMRIYDSAYYYSDQSLSISDTLMDFNAHPHINLNSSPAFQPFNPEIIYSSVGITSGINSMFSTSRYRVDSNLYHSYKNFDLRKQAFFQVRSNGVTFKGSYDGSTFFFTGISTNEIYLIKAECATRRGNYTEGLEILNFLLQKRWDNSEPYQPIVADDENEALLKILEERRRELPFRGLRWEDLRRLNLEGFNITPMRIVDGEIYTLIPNSVHYTYLIPPDVMIANPGWKQNSR